ncbi:MAG: hypothetical protein BA870_02065 [Desulfuromonadales bacterium C00003094]|jgi:hypothetical protein|nr:MAG: hypothetical protein BA870_02065 [Desulfuromonadales bacterium C00003094]
MMLLRLRFSIQTFLATFLFVTLVAGGGFAGVEEPIAAPSPDLMALQGRWIRTDSHYTIELHVRSLTIQYQKRAASYFLLAICSLTFLLANIEGSRHDY